MKSNGKIARTIDEYIQDFPQDVQVKLQSIRRLVKKLAPEAQETISYRMPAFYLNGNLVYFAAFKGHVGFFPTASGVAAFEKQLSNYKHAKGSIQFPLKDHLPIALITRIVKYRAEENRKKQSAIGRKRKET
jgi:uncharacterized protein YdhG (YjbR/CyaY superfamily)